MGGGTNCKHKTPPQSVTVPGQVHQQEHRLLPGFLLVPSRKAVQVAQVHKSNIGLLFNINTIHNKDNNNKIAVTNTLHTNKDNLCKLIPLVLIFKTVTQNTKKESIYCTDKICTV